jgi:phage repressor protein C with HTH and peptisase S24 domain
VETCVALPSIGENIRATRVRAGFGTGKAFAAAMGVDASRVSEWENDTYQPSVDTLLKIAAFLNVSVDDLLKGVNQGYEAARRTFGKRDTPADGIEAEELDQDITEGYKRDDIPVIAEGEASPQPSLLWNDDGLKSDVDDRISRPFDVRDPRAIGVRVRGDSMVPRYKPGDVVIVSPNTPVEDGDEVYVALLSGERLLKTARRSPGGWILESENRAYPARFVKKGEIGSMHPILWIRPARRARGDRKDQ